MLVHDNIKNLRKQKGLTLEELGNLVGTTKQTISRYENGEIENIPLNMLSKLATALDVDAAALLGFNAATEYIKPNRLENNIFANSVTILPGKEFAELAKNNGWVKDPEELDIYLSFHKGTSNKAIEISPSRKFMNLALKTEKDGVSKSQASLEALNDLSAFFTVLYENSFENTDAFKNYTSLSKEKRHFVNNFIKFLAQNE